MVLLSGPVCMPAVVAGAAVMNMVLHKSCIELATLHETSVLPVDDALL